MAWITPKTDWKSTDYFNAVDYNRIKNNLLQISNMVSTLYLTTNLDGEILPDATYVDRPSAYKLNQIELRLASLADLVDADFGDSVTFSDFGLSIRFDELNRIESASFSLYNMIRNQLSALPMLSFRLGLQGHTPFRF